MPESSASAPGKPDANSSLDQWLSWLEQLHPEEIDLGLERVGQVSTRASVAEVSQPVITVGGTNGKGSVVELLLHALVASGYRVGAYTSPHLLRFNERIRIDHQPVEDAALCAALSDIEAHRQETSLTYFEFTTLAAMQVFKQHHVDVIVMEVGLGGRLDAVNLWDTDCAIITSIAVDHESWLGRDRSGIALEKVEIARAGKPLIIGDREPPMSLAARGAEIGAKVLRIGHEFDAVVTNQQPRQIANQMTQADEEAGPQALRFKYGEHNHEIAVADSLGPHQITNTACAICALLQLGDLLTVPDHALETAVREARVTGRMQELDVDGAVIVLDVAHNPAAAQALAESLSTRYPQQRFHAVCAVMADKDIAPIVEAVGPVVERWYCASLEIPRALPAGDLAHHIQRDDTELYNSVEAALKAATADLADTAAAAVLVFGSFYTVTDALSYLTARSDVTKG